MTLLSVLHLEKNLLVLLGESALRSMVVAGVAGLVLALVPSRRSIVQLRVWTGILYIALAMPLLSVTLPHFNVAIPRLAWFAAHRWCGGITPVSRSVTHKSAIEDLRSQLGKRREGQVLPMIFRAGKAFS
jgi:hypothetical protein